MEEYHADLRLSYAFGYPCIWAAVACSSRCLWPRVNLQSSRLILRKELEHFTAEAGSIYYSRTRFVGWFLVLEPIDSDQGRYLVESLPLAVSKPNK